MDDRSVEFPYRSPWPWAMAAVLLGAVAVGAGAYRAVHGYPLAPRLAGTLSALALGGLGSALWALAAWMMLACWRAVRRITLDGQGISLPRSRWSSQTIAIAWKDITGGTIARAGDSRQLELISPDGSVVIRDSMLQSPESFDRLVERIQLRLGGFQVVMEQDAAVFRPRRRPQFTLAWLMVAVTFVAAVLGMHSYVYHACSWDVLPDVGVTLILLVTVPWLMVSASRGARIFAAGFAVGFWIEWTAVITSLSLSGVRLSLAGSGCAWYPLTVIVGRIAAMSPASAWLAQGIRATMVAAVLSGAVAGLAAIGIRHWFGRRRRPRQGIVAPGTGF